MFAKPFKPKCQTGTLYAEAQPTPFMKTCADTHAHAHTHKNLIHEIYTHIHIFLYYNISQCAKEFDLVSRYADNHIRDLVINICGYVSHTVFQKLQFCMPIMDNAH